MNAVLFLRAFFYLSASTVLLASISKPLRARFFAYGARDAQVSRKKSTHQKRDYEYDASQRSTSFAARIFEQLAALKVPHHWFSHFYLVSLCLSAFWLQQLQQHGQVLQWVNIARRPDHVSMTPAQVLTIWVLMVAQAGRRLFECLTLGAKSDSSMWIGHWLVGLGFYAAMSIAVWIEGPASIDVRAMSMDSTLRALASPLGSLALLLYAFAAWMQHCCHVHLSSLKKYSLPQGGFFKILICPHYTAECLIYFALSVAGAPRGCFFNWTIVSALAFVTVNLGVTASGTRTWYVQQFGERSVEGRWTMMPYAW